MAAPDRAAALRALDEQVGACKRCRLHEGRTRTVFGVGNPAGRLCFVGEGPGRDEDLRGEPFVGAAGQLLTKMIQAMGLAREDVYICNVVKCRPPENRTPLPDEMATCAGFLEGQLEIVAPEVIVAMGSTAARQLLQTTAAMGRLRGSFHEYRGVPVMPTYHPAYLLRNAEAKKPVWDDLKKVMARLGLPDPRAPR
ncbi:MAG: uracil-DNA glycosylase [Deltaproteobacteria bacterium]|nr:uracil-DNA glycosylase [Deltaproteobacteria bacterium]